MSPSVEQLYRAALALPEDDRVELAEALLAVGDPNDPPFDESWREIVRKRSAEIDAGTVEMIPLEETLARVRRLVSRDG